ncbi:MAG TPA: tRNA (adenosine(37)-N6)-dimethylallyltransferase MiaA [Candidatus Tumulicola sp.]|jgi:tRNA dimethylallyltransferase
MAERGVLVVAGATATGKTELALRLARRFDAEIVGADSRQVYRDMPIGTAAPSSAALLEIPHHCVGILDPYERYSAGRFERDALDAIAAIHARGKNALVVGGTGFYIRALTGGVSLARAYDAQLRERLAREARTHDGGFLHSWLAQLDPRRATAILPNDTYRVLRALEIHLTRDAADSSGPVTIERPAFVKIALDVPIEEIDARIVRRAQEMIENGLLEEAERIGAGAVAASAVGYPQALAHLRGWGTRQELLASLVRATKRYARRQLAWFRREPGTFCLAPDAVAGAAREKLGWREKAG